MIVKDSNMRGLWRLFSAAISQNAQTDALRAKASQSGGAAHAFCARLCSTGAGHGLCSTVVTPRSRQPRQPADLVELHPNTLPAASQNSALQQAVQHCLGQHRCGFKEILVPVSQWGAGPTHDT